MARFLPCPPLAALLPLVLYLLPACHTAGAKTTTTAVLLPVSKDDTTQQYVMGFRQSTPLFPVKAVLDRGGATLWVDCEAVVRVVHLPPRAVRVQACATSCSAALDPS
jgi:hypothetical protein